MIDYTKYILGKKQKIDITKLLLDPVMFNALIEGMCQPFQNKKIDIVAAIDAMGFVLGSRIAEKLDAGLVLIRKGGKIGIETSALTCIDYSQTEKTLEIATIALKGGERVLIVDEWSETGAQIKTSIKLIESYGGKVIGISCIGILMQVKKDPALKKYMIHEVL